MNFVGLDLSLTSTGVCVLDDGSFDPWTLSPPKDRTKKPAVDMRGAERLDWFYGQLGSLISNADAIAVEGYSFGSKNGREAMGELGGIARMLIWRSRIPFMIVPPTSLKLFATGKADAPKDSIMMHVFKRWGVEAGDNNQADAVVLAAMCEARFGRSDAILTEFQKKALKGTETVTDVAVSVLPPVRTRTRPSAVQPVAQKT